MKTRLSGGMLFYWCPGCDELHGVRVAGDRAWGFDGDRENPTIKPSVLCFSTYSEDGASLPGNERRTLCHHFVKAGMIQFLADCPHKLKNQTVVLPHIPDGYFAGETQD